MTTSIKIRGGRVILLLANALGELVPAIEHQDSSAGEKGTGAEEAARREVALCIEDVG